MSEMHLHVLTSQMKWVTEAWAGLLAPELSASPLFLIILIPIWPLDSTLETMERAAFHFHRSPVKI